MNYDEKKKLKINDKHKKNCNHCDVKKVVIKPDVQGYGSKRSHSVDFSPEFSK